MYRPPAWKHPICDEQQMKAIAVAHREPRTFSDKWAYGLVRLLRWGTDLCTGYRHDPDPNKKYQMNERKWLVRFVLLETVSPSPRSSQYTSLQHYEHFPDETSSS